MSEYGLAVNQYAEEGRPVGWLVYFQSSRGALPVVGLRGWPLDPWIVCRDDGGYRSFPVAGTDLLALVPGLGDWL